MKKERKQNSKREENIRFKKWAAEYLDKEMKKLKEIEKNKPKHFWKKGGTI